MVLSPPYTGSPPGNTQVADTSASDHTANVLSESDIPTARETTLSFATQTSKAVLQPAINQIMDLANLSPNWDSYDAMPPTHLAINVARQLVRVVYEAFWVYAPDRVLPESIAPLADGGVQLEWCTRGIELDIQVGPSGSFGYLLIDRRTEAARYREEYESSWDTILRAIAAVVLAR